MRAHDGLGGRLPGPQREAIEAATHTGERTLAEQAFERFEHERIPIMVGRCRLLYGETLNRRGPADARGQLRAAHEVLTGCGLNGYAERARFSGPPAHPKASSCCPSWGVGTTGITEVASPLHTAHNNGVLPPARVACAARQRGH
ncbi:hypothetical protein ACFWA5_11440 [Streptomyces mirabilis]|uniref:hypothetical protein n=1 Tax=Streptomyces mirabilis TaxID=68239 RepID=UPI003649969A